MLLPHEPAAEAVPIWFVTSESWPSVETELPPTARAFAKACGFAASPAPGKLQIVPDASGAIAAVLFGIERASSRNKDLFLPGRLATALPGGTYRFANAPHDATSAALSWLLSSYRFTRYKPVDVEGPSLRVPADVDLARIERIAAAVAFGRDLVNTPANDMGPDALEAAALKLASRCGAKCSVTRGDKLLQTNFPLIHAVGRASDKAPRLVDISWGDPNGPKVTLVGKGVCFDSGGLDIKPSSGMLLMKKDMGGAATALALAAMIMEAGLAIRLRVLLPIVENAISSTAYRPGDIYPSRKKLFVEIGNTDAEGRLVLADALAFADEEAPELLVDFATLTGAARVALGPDLPPFYTEDENLAAEIMRFGTTVCDPVWRMPLWEPYDKLIDGKVGDLVNVSSGNFAGSVTAALFLRRFVEHAKSWVHFDIYAWTPSPKSGRPEGGEVQAARLLYDLFEARFGVAPKVESENGPERRIVRRVAVIPDSPDEEGSVFDDLVP
jgi:leucyl aminopeptidase